MKLCMATAQILAAQRPDLVRTTTHLRAIRRSVNVADPSSPRCELRHRALIRLAMLCSVLTLSAGCGSDATRPGIRTAAAVAAHFDSLYAARIRDVGFDNRAAMLFWAEIGPAYGELPTEVTVQTATGSEQWRLSQFDFVDVNAGGSTDHIAVLYRDADAHTVVFFESSVSGDSIVAGLFIDDSIYPEQVGGSTSTSLLSHAGKCAVSPGLANSQVTSLVDANDSCTFAKFETSFSVAFPSAALVDPALGSLSGSAVVRGEQFVHMVPPP
jgi:hypothetical protein